ncbi:Outer membrane efflux protein [Oceanicola granulosus HTCC2516]|uniref:Outer membrane efflux protein n=1 Tax=Oceanicola granulosus (strain ATCC BAA-861 / DSM 15982 / KCTC 12143 / HTCC2516) TaxID=314256 RepID=Q2CBV1_OCEGH|nr:TolC family outer membrane protein [Oceanicola granulosus]EAR50169.1 Outer membrane efflux protein [Oceanicola granulosus HTCC2516]
MIRFGKTFRTIAASLLIGAAAGAASAETLADTLVSAYENSGLLEQNRALLRAADEDVAIAAAALKPILSWSANASIASPRPVVGGSVFGGGDTRTITTSASLNAEMLLYDFGRSETAIAAQKEVVLATREQLRDIEQQILLRAVTAYLNIKRFSEFVALRDSNVRVITQELRAARDRFEVGEVTRTDVSLAEAALAAARSELASSQGERAQAVEEFIAAVGRPPGALAPVQPAPIEYGLDAAKDFAVRNHPLIRAAQHNIAAAELNIVRAEAAQRPTVRAQGSINFDTDFNSSEQFGISIGGPISQGGALAAQVRQAMAQRDAQRAGLHITVNQIEQQVGNAYALLAVAVASAEASDRQIRASRVAFQGVREEATLGARTTLDVLNAEQDLLDAQANLISAQVDQAIASYNILAALGLLTAEHLNLGVQSYDPAAYYNLVKDAPLGLSDRGRALDRVLEAIGD